MKATLFLLSLLMGLNGCSHLASKSENEIGKSPKELQKSFEKIKALCEKSAKFGGFKGFVSIKVHSEKFKGQFSAQAKASNSSPPELRVEVANLFGGTEALLELENDQFFLTRPTRSPDRQKIAALVWNGIPLRWAPGLFSGHVPCPQEREFKEAKVSYDDREGGTVIELGLQRFTFVMRDSEEKPWADRIIWKSSDQETPEIRFYFESADLIDDRFTQWEAKSTLGSVKVHWRDAQSY